MAQYSREMRAILNTIAKREGTSIAEVVREMEIAMEAVKNSKDPYTAAAFRQLFGSKAPTLEEFVRALAKPDALSEG